MRVLLCFFNNSGLLTWIQVSSRWDSKLEGLCGTYDYNTKNDFHKPDGSIDPDVVTFTDSWKEEDIIVTHQNESSPCQVCQTVIVCRELSLLYLIK